MTDTELDVNERNDGVVSEFGKGTAYCLGLFLSHSDGYRNFKTAYEKSELGTEAAATIWFNGASDHLQELIIPENYSDGLRLRLETFCDKVFRCRKSATEPDVYYCIEEAKNILFAIDCEQGIQAIRSRNP